MRIPFCLLCAIAGCATPAGPKPVAQTATAAERAALLDRALQDVDRFSITITSDSASTTAPVALNSTLTLNGPTITLLIDGALGTNKLNAELRAQGEVTSRTVAARANATSNQGPTPSRLKPALTQGLVRFGLKGLLARLMAEELPQHADADLAGAVALQNPTILGAEVVATIPCTRLSFSVGPDAVSVCVADATGLPIDRKVGVGEEALTETYVWAGTP
jgi:hypothetical protein